MGTHTIAPENRRGERTQGTTKKSKSKVPSVKASAKQALKPLKRLCNLDTLPPPIANKSHRVKKLTTNVQNRIKLVEVDEELESLKEKIEQYEFLSRYVPENLSKADRRTLAGLNEVALLKEEVLLQQKRKVLNKKLQGVQFVKNRVFNEDNTPPPVEVVLQPHEVQERARRSPVEKTAGSRRVRSRSKSGQSSASARSKAKAHTYTGLHWSSVFAFRRQSSTSRVARIALCRYNASKSPIHRVRAFELYKAGKISKRQALRYKGVNRIDRVILSILIKNHESIDVEEPSTKKRRVSTDEDVFDDNAVSKQVFVKVPMLGRVFKLLYHPQMELEQIKQNIASRLSTLSSTIRFTLDIAAGGQPPKLSNGTMTLEQYNIKPNDTLRLVSDATAVIGGAKNKKRSFGNPIDVNVESSTDQVKSGKKAKTTTTSSKRKRSEIDDDDSHSESTKSSKSKSSKSSLPVKSKAEVKADTNARLEKAYSNVKRANKYFGEGEYNKALVKYNRALIVYKSLDVANVEKVINKVSKCLVQECTNQVTLKLQLACIEHCIFFAKRSKAYTRMNIARFHFQHATILLSLMKKDKAVTDNASFVLYHGLLTKSVNHIITAYSSVGKEVQRKVPNMKNDADTLLSMRARSFAYKQSSPFLKLLEGINMKGSLFTAAKRIRRTSQSSNKVEAVLNELMLLGESELEPELYEKQFNILIDKLSKTLQRLTKREINLGNGLSTEHFLFVLMNYATPACSGWKNGAHKSWIHDRMNTSEGCISFWLKSVITCLERSSGIEKKGKHDNSCISLTDRLFWVSDFNTKEYKSEISKICKKAKICEDVMHLIPMILLGLKVKYAKMNGHRPSILSTGAETRDKLFDKNGVVISPDATYTGSVPHSELFMRKDRFLRFYPTIEQQHKCSLVLARFYSPQFYTFSNCTFTEDWTGLGNLSEEELKKFQEEHDKLMFKIRSKGGMTSSELAQLASALHDVDWNHDDLSPVMQLRFVWCLEHKNRHFMKEKDKIDEDDFIEFLTKLHKSRVKGVKKGGKTTGEMATLASVLDDEEVDGDYNKLSPEWKLIFELHMARKKIDEDDFIEFLTKLHKSRVKGVKKGGKTTGEMATLASVLDDEEVDGDYNKLSPEWKLIFELHMARKKIDEDEFIDFLNDLRDSCKKGTKTTNEMAKLASALHDVKGDYSKLSPEWKFIFELHMARKKIDEDAFIKFMTKLRGSRVKNSKIGGEMAKLASVLDDDGGDYNKLSSEWKFIFELHMARKKIDEKAFIKILKELHGSNKKKGETTGRMATLYKKLHKVNWKPDSTPELRFAFDLIHAGYNNRHKDEMNEKQFIKYLKDWREKASKSNSVQSEAKTKALSWNSLYIKKTQEERNLIQPLKDIIEPVVNSINFADSDKLGGANDKLLEGNLLTALHKFDKTNPTNDIKLIEWCSQNHSDFQNATTDKRGTISGTGGKYSDFDYFNRQPYVVTCDSSTLGRGLVANSRAQIEMQVIIRALLNANITHHQKEEYTTTIKKHMLKLLKTVVERRSN